MNTKRRRELSDIEEAVRIRLAAILNVDVQQLDDGSAASLPDLQINWPDRDPAPVEITRAIDTEQTKAVASDGFAPWTSTTLSYSWTLTSQGPPPIWKKLRAQVEPLLKALEDAGLHGFDPGTTMQYQVRTAGTLADPELSIWRILNQLAVLRIQQGHAFSRVKGPHTIGVGLAQGGTWDQTANAVPSWISDFVSNPDHADNVRKLDRGGREAHLAVEVHLSEAGYAVVRGITDEERRGLLPNTQPNIPATVTDLWLAASFEHGDVLHWSQTNGWARHLLLGNRPGRPE